MYLRFFKLQKMPFRLAPDPAFLYWSTGHSAALARIHSAPTGVVLIGVKGSGKSTLLDYVASNTPASLKLARISLPPSSPATLAATLAPVEQARALVLCDNAHLFAMPVLIQLQQKALVAGWRLVLAGEPELARLVARPGLGDPCTLPLLGSDEVARYIAHRLAVAGGPTLRIFSDEICKEIHRETHGNPRLINALCDAAMALACERDVQQVGIAEILKGLEDIATLLRTHTASDPPIEEGPEMPAAVPQPTSALGHMQLLHEGQVVLARDLTPGVLRVGRGIDNDVRIDGRYISRQHCRIVTNTRMCLLEDVRSTNGLFVNEKRVRNSRLRDGDVIQLGEHQIRYTDYRADEGESD